MNTLLLIIVMNIMLFPQQSANDSILISDLVELQIRQAIDNSNNTGVEEEELLAVAVQQVMEVPKTDNRIENKNMISLNYPVISGIIILFLSCYIAYEKLKKPKQQQDYKKGINCLRNELPVKYENKKLLRIRRKLYSKLFKIDEIKGKAKKYDIGEGELLVVSNIRKYEQKKSFR